MGANTAGCLIDGKPFIATSYGGGILSKPIPALEHGFTSDTSYYLVMNGKLNGDAVSVTLYFKSHKPGIYLLNKDTQYYPVDLHALSHATYSVEDNQNEVYVTNFRHTGQIVVSHAVIASGVGISSGTFEFTAASQIDLRKTVTITNGRFDRKQ